MMKGPVVLCLVMRPWGRDFFYWFLPQFSRGKDGSAGKAGGEGRCSAVTPINVTAALLPVH